MTKGFGGVRDKKEGLNRELSFLSDINFIFRYLGKETLNEFNKVVYGAGGDFCDPESGGGYVMDVKLNKELERDEFLFRYFYTKHDEGYVNENTGFLVTSVGKDNPLLIFESSYDGLKDVTLNNKILYRPGSWEKIFLNLREEALVIRNEIIKKNQLEEIAKEKNNENDFIKTYKRYLGNLD